MEKLLILNPGSTSTKIAYYEDEKQIGCTYEVCSEGVEPVRPFLQNIPVATLPWSTHKIRNLYPILINNLYHSSHF